MKKTEQEREEEKREIRRYEEAKRKKEKERDEQDTTMFGFRFRKWDRRVQYFALFGSIVLLIGFALFPRFVKSDDVRLARPLDLGKLLYFRTDTGDWYRLSVQDDDLFDSITEMLRGTYDPRETFSAPRSRLAVLFVCREEDNPLRPFWFYDGRYCESVGENQWKSFDRRTIAFSFEGLQNVIMEKGSPVPPGKLPDWTADVED